MLMILWHYYDVRKNPTMESNTIYWYYSQRFVEAEPDPRGGWTHWHTDSLSNTQRLHEATGNSAHVMGYIHTDIHTYITRTYVFTCLCNLHTCISYTYSIHTYREDRVNSSYVMGYIHTDIHAYIIRTYIFTCLCNLHACTHVTYT